MIGFGDLMEATGIALRVERRKRAFVVLTQTKESKVSEGNNKKQNEPAKKPTEQKAKTELSKQDLDKIVGGADKNSDEETIRNATTKL